MHSGLGSFQLLHISPHASQPKGPGSVGSESVRGDASHSIVLLITTFKIVVTVEFCGIPPVTKTRIGLKLDKRAGHTHIN